MKNNLKHNKNASYNVKKVKRMILFVAITIVLVIGADVAFEKNFNNTQSAKASDANKNLVKREANEGNAIGNHTYSLCIFQYSHE